MIIFTQSISQGVFPDNMKLAEVILLYKGRETDQSELLSNIPINDYVKSTGKNNIFPCLQISR